ncbi:MAG: N-acetyl-gamma-glutamyl-phosphate reductase [Bdellovibrionales bacterium]|nr:N-acetyl-gamma-glutamyl-phosphate reductase [Bdellovibrionales bacterium]
MEYRVAIIGASGYTGAELLRLLAHHPACEVVVATGESQAGKRVGELYPHLARFGGLQLQSLGEAEDAIQDADVVFCGLPHGESASVLSKLTNRLVIDLGSDFRLKDPAVYNEWYGRGHPCPEALDQWTYGLTELFRGEVRTAGRIANPGCYATAVTLAAAPVAKEGFVAGPIAVAAVSGLSGAGRTPQPSVHFSHAFEDVRAYKVGVHQHTPEIEAALARLGATESRVSLTTHLVPMTRGIHATVTFDLRRGTSSSDLVELFRATYANEPFVEVSDQPPATKSVRGSNRALLHAHVDSRCGRGIVLCVIDNLVKGASGQAIQNANCALGLEEGLGLSAEGLYP